MLSLPQLSLQLHGQVWGHLPPYLKAKLVPCSICWGGNGFCHRKALHKEGAKGHCVTAISPLRKQSSQKHHQTLPGNLIPYSESRQKTVTGPNPAGKARIRLLTCLEGKKTPFPFPGDRFMTCG